MAGPFAVVCLVLAGAGAAKVVKPGDTARALALFGWPVGFNVVRSGGAVEASVAVAALITAEPILAAAVALSYLAFAVWVAVAMARGVPLSSCGCFGVPDTPPTVTHVVFDVVAAATAAAAGIVVLPSLRDTLADQPWSGLPFVGLVGLATWMVFVVLTELPRIHAARTDS